MIGHGFASVLAAAKAGRSGASAAASAGATDAPHAGWAFEAIYRDLVGPVTGYLRLHGAPEPDDLASETFLGVFRGIGSFDGDEAQFRSWVFTIAHRRLTDEWRRLGRRIAVTDGDPLEQVERLGLAGGDVEHEALASLGTREIEALCARLVGDQRTVLLLRILADLTIEQVAQIVGKSIPATKALQRRGLRALRRELEGDGAPL